MRTVVCAVKDLASNSFAQPMFLPSTGYAVRMFGGEVNRKADDNNLSKYPKDFELWQLGYFDEDSGHFDQSEGTQRLARASDLVITPAE